MLSFKCWRSKSKARFLPPVICRCGTGCDFSLCVSAVTIISGVIMFILFVSELQYYLTKEVSPSTSPDDLTSSSSGQNAPGEIKIDFHHRGIIMCAARKKEVLLSDSECWSRTGQLNEPPFYTARFVYSTTCTYMYILVTFRPLTSTQSICRSWIQFPSKEYQLVWHLKYKCLKYLITICCRQLN